MAERQGETEPWALVDALMKDPSMLHGSMARLLSPSLRRGWQRLTAERRALLELLARCAFSEDQALRFYDGTERSEAGIELTDADLIANPYLLFESDRRATDPIAFRTVDRGVHPAADTLRTVDDPADQRRVRALTIDLLDEAAREGHTLLPRSWLISRARERALQPPCPLGENVLDATEDFFGSRIERSTTRTGEPAYQLDRLVECRTIIRKEVLGRMRGRPHKAVHDWPSIVNEELNESLPEDAEARELEERARKEKAAALEQMFRSRLSVLIGSAGTGKTTLLKMLCSLLPEQDVLLLAPTGKARVRLEERTRRRGSGQTLAQFLIGLRRYDGGTGAYFPNRKVPRCADYRTVIVDECSMLTEEQLAALIDALRNVERLVLVGDPRQLPPIGAGRPFSDIVRELEPREWEHASTEIFVPRCASGYAELTIMRRQQVPPGGAPSSSGCAERTTTQRQQGLIASRHASCVAFQWDFHRFPGRMLPWTIPQAAATACCAWCDGTTRTNSTRNSSQSWYADCHCRGRTTRLASRNHSAVRDTWMPLTPSFGTSTVTILVPRRRLKLGRSSHPSVRAWSAWTH